MAMDGAIVLPAATAGFIYGISPGPGVLAVFGLGASRGPRASAGFLCGHLVGDAVWAALALTAIIGIDAIGPTFFDLLGLVSAAYLAWLGVRALRTRRSVEGEAVLPMRRPLLHGLVFGLTNPKAYPVAVATFTALLAGKAALLGWDSLPGLVAAGCVGSAAAYVILVAVIAATAVRRFYRRHEIAITRISGLLFLGFAVNAAWHAAPGLLARRP
jgi:threonine efflux protein